ncbi:LOW QUALITY PROTEIN: hypothetical protein BU14_0166s0010 [Porphyra umbilicalis]|uniref:Uncharacterized protein n=1 Tax=Porphyra umbilicalis TaxID=2786 RepID=A0A1X6P7V3_PORUM|nr:LOW QUALITY PROTEIN: hypothetical protein BU14_0166s0010 [Porphyra umbilicalis]|eukprot:OSX76971.1 LOW QUALITY PROTEIN: hypothetical protein BU14_0166s0010 [Porphyra umbilicalis]
MLFSEGCAAATPSAGIRLPVQHRRRSPLAGVRPPPFAATVSASDGQPRERVIHGAHRLVRVGLPIQRRRVGRRPVGVGVPPPPPPRRRHLRCRPHLGAERVDGGDGGGEQRPLRRRQAPRQPARRVARRGGRAGGGRGGGGEGRPQRVPVDDPNDHVGRRRRAARRGGRGGRPRVAVVRRCRRRRPHRRPVHPEAADPLGGPPAVEATPPAPPSPPATTRRMPVPRRPTATTAASPNAAAAAAATAGGGGGAVTATPGGSRTTPTAVAGCARGAAAAVPTPGGGGGRRPHPTASATGHPAGGTPVAGVCARSSTSVDAAAGDGGDIGAGAPSLSPLPLPSGGGGGGGGGGGSATAADTHGGAAGTTTAAVVAAAPPKTAVGSSHTRSAAAAAAAGTSTVAARRSAGGHPGPGTHAVAERRRGVGAVPHGSTLSPPPPPPPPPPAACASAAASAGAPPSAPPGVTTVAGGGGAPPPSGTGTSGGGGAATPPRRRVDDRRRGEPPADGGGEVGRVGGRRRRCVDGVEAGGEAAGEGGGERRAGVGGRGARRLDGGVPVKMGTSGDGRKRPTTSSTSDQCRHCIAHRVTSSTTFIILVLAQHPSSLHAATPMPARDTDPSASRATHFIRSSSPPAHRMHVGQHFLNEPLACLQKHVLASFHFHVHTCSSVEWSMTTDTGHHASVHVLVGLMTSFMFLRIGLTHGGLHLMTSHPFHVQTPLKKCLPHAFHVLTHRVPSFLAHRVFIVGGAGGHTGSSHDLRSHSFQAHLPPAVM